MMKHFLILLFCSVFFSTNVFSQTVSNVFAEQQGNDLIIFYTLETDEPCEINLYISNDAGRTWEGPMQKVSGDAGKNIIAGKKQLRWIVLEERESLVGNQVQFRITAIEDRVKEPEMVLVKGGAFLMGTNGVKDNALSGDEWPKHNVILRDYYIGRYEITQELWAKIMGSNPSHFKCLHCPIENISWDEVQEFIRKLNHLTGKSFDLPSEAQWEYAASGGVNSSGYIYSGSNDLTKVAWYVANAENKTSPVGYKRANELGIYDMTGNVWEWCRDWYASDYYENSSKKNPEGPAQGSQRVVRGGAWRTSVAFSRITTRFFEYPDAKSNIVGFRLIHY